MNTWIGSFLDKFIWNGKWFGLCTDLSTFFYFFTLNSKFGMFQYFFHFVQIIISGRKYSNIFHICFPLIFYCSLRLTAFIAMWYACYSLTLCIHSHLFPWKNYTRIRKWLEMLEFECKFAIVLWLRRLQAIMETLAPLPFAFVVAGSKFWKTST